MRKIKFILLGLVGSLLLLTSCEKDLDVTNPNQPSPDTYWQQEEHAIKTLTSAYAYTQAPGMWTGTWTVFPAEIFKTEFPMMTPWKSSNRVFEFTDDPSNSASSGLWDFIYTGNYFANQVLKYTDQIEDISDERKKEIKAEARFVRAYNNYRLAIYFEKAPVINKVIEKKENFFQEKNSNAEIWEQVEKDLQYGIDNLPESNVNEGRADKYAARALLGKAHMQQLEWSKAKNQFNKIINSGNFGLVDDYASLFTGLNEDTKEHIFAIKFTHKDAGGTSENHAWPLMLHSKDANGWECHWVSKWFANWMAENDTMSNGLISKRVWGTIRYDSTINSYTKPHPPYDTLANGDLEQRPLTEEELSTKSFQMKYALSTDDADPMSGESDIIILRYADILLSQAESILMSGNGTKDEAIDLINQVRDRSNTVNMPYSLSKEEVLEKLRHHDRMAELALERHRWPDLRRWSKAEGGDSYSAQHSYIKNVFEEHNHPNVDNFKVRNLVYPIPRSEITSNKNMEQHELWK